MNMKNNKNIDLTISTAKPPIFWKDKEIQNFKFKIGNQKKLKELLIYKINELELIIKKNYAKFN